MALVRVSLLKGRSPELRRKIGDAIHRAMVETIDVPQHDRFQLLTEHEPGDLVYDSEYLGIARTNEIVIVQITMNLGRTLAKKRALFRRSLVEVAKENWSFGLGEASYAPPQEIPA